MPRKYRRQLGARKYVDYTDANLQTALGDVVEGRLTLREAEERYGVPRATLSRKYRGVQVLRPGRQKVLNEHEENVIVSAIEIAANWGYPFTHMEIRIMVKSYLDRKGLRERRFKENLPGNDWLQSFLKRHHELTVRLAQNMKRSRSEITAVEMNAYFDNLEECLSDVDPENIINYDETNLTDDPGQVKVVVRRGVKRALRVMDNSKSSTSLMFAVSASGKRLPPYIVYKAKNLYPEWLLGGPENCFYNRSKTGWFDNIIFEDWFFKVVIPYFRSREGKKAVIGDNLASHLSTKIIEECENNNIMFIFLPPNSTHVCQPLDVAFFKPMKTAWRKVLTEWKMKYRGCIPKTQFPSLLRKTLDNLENKSSENIKSGFRATGIFPVNRLEVLKRLPGFIPADNNNKNLNPNMEKAFDDIIRRHVSVREQPTLKRKKKLNVGPGMAVRLEDITSEKESVEPENDSISSENEVPDLNEDSNSDEKELSSDDETSILKHPPTIADLNEGSFVVVRFQYNVGTKKECSKKFVAKIEKINKKSYIVSCLRQYKETKNIFVFPDVEDVNSLEFGQITSVLKTPSIRRGLHIFNTSVNLL